MVIASIAPAGRREGLIDHLVVGIELPGLGKPVEHVILNSHARDSDLLDAFVPILHYVDAPNRGAEDG